MSNINFISPKKEDEKKDGSKKVDSQRTPALDFHVPDNNKSESVFSRVASNLNHLGARGVEGQNDDKQQSYAKSNETISEDKKLSKKTKKHNTVVDALKKIFIKESGRSKSKFEGKKVSNPGQIRSGSSVNFNNTSQEGEDKTKLAVDYEPIDKNISKENKPSLVSTELPSQSKIDNSVNTKSKEHTKKKNKNEEMKLSEPNSYMDENFGGVDVNLIPWKNPIAHRRHLVRIGIVVASLVVVVAWGLLLKLQVIDKENRVNNLRSLEAQLDEQLANIDTSLLDEGSGLAIRQRKLLGVMSQIPHWSKFISWLENNTDSDVYYRAITIDSNGEVGLEVQSPSYVAVARQWVVFQNSEDWIESVEIANVDTIVGETGEMSGVNFNIKLQVKLESLREEISLLSK